MIHFFRRDKYNSFITLITIVTSFYLNAITKLAFADPRPYAVSPEIKALQCDCDFGSPSGHAQLSVTSVMCILIYIDENKLLHKLKHRAIWNVLIYVWLVVYAAVVCFSRFYFGMHTIWQLVIFPS